ncbi:MAG: DsrE family protein [Candidatus Krumholzibacteriia bacterium]|nr:DsrE family protein [bacterium]MCB9513680.1 DsrE family protein [Candidatus Latescibacterota bacterium]MCB9515477.1 DsrE family protein [Candidatus Latescibacterota bacterium]
MANLAVLITRDGMGSADAELQHKLMRTWLKVVAENGRLPGALCFYTDGVKLVVEGSPILEELRAMEAAGVHLVICKTCLDHFGLADKVAVGVVGGMGDIVAAQWSADKVITL